MMACDVSCAVMFLFSELGSFYLQTNSVLITLLQQTNRHSEHVLKTLLPRVQASFIKLIDFRY